MRYLVETGEYDNARGFVFLHEDKRDLESDVKSCIANNPDILDEFGDVALYDGYLALLSGMVKLGYTEEVNLEDSYYIGPLHDPVIPDNFGPYPDED